LFVFVSVVLSSESNYLGDENVISNGVSKLSECVNSLLLDVVCYVITDNFIADAETNDITLLENVDYTITSVVGCLNLALDVSIINVKGTCKFSSLEV
jgi:hypothetical protein